MDNNQLEQREWSELPGELIGNISNKMTDISEYISFRAVCNPWRSSTTPTNFYQQMPWLLLPYDPEDTSRLFYCLSNQKSFTLNLPDSQRKVIYGSCDGWLIMMDKVCSLSLLNPISRACIQLPELTDLPDFRTFEIKRTEEKYVCHYNDGRSGILDLDMISCIFVCNVFLSPNHPFPDDCIVTVTAPLSPRFLCIRLGKSGDTKWHLVDSTVQGGIESLMRYNDKLFMVGTDKSTVICEIYPEPRVQLVPSLKVPNYFCITYLGMLDGNLILVTNRPVRSEEGCMKENIDMFQLDTNGEMKWSNLEETGSTTLLLVNNRLITVERGSFGSNGKYIYFHSRRTKVENQQDKLEVLQMEETGSTLLISHPVSHYVYSHAVWFIPSFR